MRGIHWLKIVTKDCKYNLTLRRNITVVRGDSGTGKSSIVKHVRRYLESNGDYNITLESDCNVVVLSGDFELDSYKLSKTNNSIILIDEGVRYLGSNEFKHCVEDSSNYFVLITRCNLSNLPFSYKEIYSLVTRKNNGEFITENRELFENHVTSSVKMDCILTEDSNSGRDMLKEIFGSKVDSSFDGGNSSLLTSIRKHCDRGLSVLAIADGAAFGNYIGDILSYIEYSNVPCVLWLPESFEYVLLLSGIVHRNDIPKILDEPYNYIYSEEFISWERYFTHLVEEISSASGHHYNKHSLNKRYKTSGNIIKFINAMPKEIRP